MSPKETASIMTADVEHPVEHHPAVSITAEVEAKYGIKSHLKCLAACTLFSMCPFQYGLDFGLIGGLQAMKGFLEVFGHPSPSVPGGWNISPGRQQLISSLMTLGAFLSSSFAGPTATFLSRRQTIWAASLLCIVANIIMMTTTSIGGLYAGRLLLGLANGFYMTFSQLYIQEVAPARYRGLMISSFHVWTSVGSLIGNVVDNFTEKIEGRDSYMIPLGLIFIFPVLISAGLFAIPESPRWLMMQGKEEQARKSLRWLRPYSDGKVEEEMKDIQLALAAEGEAIKGANVWDMFRDPVDRRRTVLSVCALSVQGASGAMYMIAYGTYFFKMAGIGKPFENHVMLSALGVLAILVNSAMITKFGRRRVFLMSGLSICAVTQLLTAVVYTVHPRAKSTGQAVVALAVVYILGYNGMVASYAWVSGGELPSQRLRSYTFGLATAIGFFAAWLTTFTAPYFINPDSMNWGPKYGYIWTPSCILAALWVYFFLPEVKGRTLEEIDQMFEARLPARKFRKYVCVSRDGRGGVANESDSVNSEKGEEVVHAEEVKRVDS